MICAVHDPEKLMIVQPNSDPYRPVSGMNRGLLYLPLISRSCCLPYFPDPPAPLL